jgi:hypothetical protein
LSDPSIYRTSPATNISSLFAAPSRRKIFAASNYWLDFMVAFRPLQEKNAPRLGFADRATVAATLERVRARPPRTALAPRFRAARATPAPRRRRDTAPNGSRAAITALALRPRSEPDAAPTALFSCIGSQRR